MDLIVILIVDLIVIKGYNMDLMITDLIYGSNSNMDLIVMGQNSDSYY